ncbi:response regulator receiver protein [Candidatus Magnetobacterium bavaricum]|uniref:Response regulator receiver protein n=1 Tax=Candidatus Magnetobacterium bavaricum TaxID=29290 RepID=A0A0F3GJR8_9BACT|nr:response regulator receiver protein [Candidatus Magnetobacterium bavaricum]
MGRKKILVIDDEAIVRISCKRVLETEGYDVELASSGTMAVGCMEKERYDLVITDLMMPDMDGFELIGVISEKWPHLNVVVMTGYGTDETRLKSVELGAAIFLKKPFLPEQLLAVASAVGGTVFDD